MVLVNRDRHDIVIDVLKKASTGKSKTILMREVGLSFLQTKQYIGSLVDMGLLAVGENRLYRTTKKGTEFLEKCGECPLFNWDKQNRKLPR